MSLISPKFMTESVLHMLHRENFASAIVAVEKGIELARENGNFQRERAMNRLRDAYQKMLK